VVHHTYTNIPGYDHDIDKAILLRLNPKDKLYGFHYYQNIYAFFLYPLVTANWIFYSDYVMFYEEYKKGRVQLKDIGIFFGFKILNLILLLLLPILLLSLPVWVILFAYFCGHLAAGLSIAIVFQLAHVTENVAYFEPDVDGHIPNNWAVHEMLTTSDFATNNRLLFFLVGGLNFQVEHHLFPSICHVHYPALQKIVKETAQEFNLPYNENPTFLGALKSHYLRIKRLGRTERL
jgi:linoleoyl-CoA desaturase